MHLKISYSLCSSGGECWRHTGTEDCYTLIFGCCWRFHGRLVVREFKVLVGVKMKATAHEGPEQARPNFDTRRL